MRFLVPILLILSSLSAAELTSPMVTVVLDLKGPSAAQTIASMKSEVS